MSVIIIISKFQATDCRVIITEAHGMELFLIFFLLMIITNKNYPYQQ